MKNSRWKVLSAAAAFAGAVGLAAPPPAWAIDKGNIFELEGNAVDDSANPVLPDDWEDVEDGSDNATATTIDPNGLHGGIVPDTFVPANNDEVFTGGGSKDDLFIQLGPWLHKTAKPTPDKNNITNAYAAAYTCTAAADAANECDEGDTVVYFGLDRFANNGAADVGFWFFQSDITLKPHPPASSGFNGEHQDGDILILSTFEQGGVVSNVEVFEWCGGCGTDGNVNLAKIGDFGKCNGSGQAACAIANAGNAAAFWPFTPKFGTAGTFPTNSFFEGGINLNAPQIFGDDVPCFTSFLAETRSSPSVDATLKDFALGQFRLCAIEGSKSCVPDAGATCDNGIACTENDECVGIGDQMCLDRFDNPVIDPADGGTVLSLFEINVNNTGPATVHGAAIKEKISYADYCDVLDPGFNQDLCDNAVPPNEFCEITAVDGTPVGPVNLPANTFVEIPSNGGSYDGSLASGATVAVEILCDTMDNPLTDVADLAAKSDPALTDFNIFPEDGSVMDTCPPIAPPSGLMTTKACDDVRLMAMDDGSGGTILAVEVLIDNITITNTGETTLVDVGVTDDKICAIGVDCIASGLTLGPGDVVVIKDDGTGDVLSDVPLNYLPSATDEGLIDGTTDKYEAFVGGMGAMFTDNASASGRDLFSGATVESLAGTATCDLCE